MKGILKIAFIGLVLLPLLIYLNPFVWFLRAKRPYFPNLETERLLHTLNSKYGISANVYNNEDTLWYFRDVETGKIKDLEGYVLTIEEDKGNLDSRMMKRYLNEFYRNFVHRSYYNSFTLELNSGKIICELRK
ncbi:hypothetical protein [Siphonobacter sp. SORGH_AS_1065]|uniref:hypothetical protein n=1 Tax=Siphonobacter sp. SORGH_AS_1065 TaxID=3041795 RepID=UPI00278204E3|nr:hypothetical protein [Siphonobacter sp. SORGH_AS_1065]MDQ1086867.1 hypothetical protein [Siphonobacter sp. SORGH_AS_1065]